MKTLFRVPVSREDSHQQKNKFNSHWLARSKQKSLLSEWILTVSHVTCAPIAKPERVGRWPLSSGYGVMAPGARTAVTDTLTLRVA